ncbi:hypothetical protein ABID59_004098 [Bradyrhizobium sp. S3.3.6]|uniref:hypothetical protein n=1 Tax=Bradyrhizobium sp. S3.3.6 TaxID=3156429 RepID=UPI003396C62B
MKSATLLVLGFVFVGVWSQDSATGQTSVAPPVSLAPPKASPPRAGAGISPAASDNRSSTPATNGLSLSPNPAVDYDGFSAGTVEDNDTPHQATRPTKPRAARDSKTNPDTKSVAGQDPIDREDAALKRKLMICQSCK